MIYARRQLLKFRFRRGRIVGSRSEFRVPNPEL